MTGAVRRLLERALGLAYAAALGYGLYLLWTAWPELVKVLPQSWRGFAGHARLPIEILAAFLALSLGDWLWRQTVGRVLAAPERP